MRQNVESPTTRNSEHHTISTADSLHSTSCAYATSVSKSDSPLVPVPSWTQLQSLVVDSEGEDIVYPVKVEALSRDVGVRNRSHSETQREHVARVKVRDGIKRKSAPPP